MYVYSKQKMMKILEDLAEIIFPSRANRTLDIIGRLFREGRKSSLPTLSTGSSAAFPSRFPEAINMRSCCREEAECGDLKEVEKHVRESKMAAFAKFLHLKQSKLSCFAPCVGIESKKGSCLLHFSVGG